METLSTEEIIERIKTPETAVQEDVEDLIEENVDEVRRSHSAALEHMDFLIEYFETQSETLLSDKLLLRKLRGMIKKNIFRQKNKQL